MKIKAIEKIAQLRLGGTTFAQRRPSAASASGSQTSAPTVANNTAKTSNQPTASAANQEFNFARESRKFLNPLMQDMRARPGAYSDQATQRYQKMMGKFRDQVRDMKANPQKYTEQQQRQILQDWRSQVQKFRGWQQGDRKTVGNVRPINRYSTDRYNKKDVSFGNGVTMRVSNPDPDKSIAYNRRAMQSQRAYNNYKREMENQQLSDIADFAMDMHPEWYPNSRRGRIKVSPSLIAGMRRNAGTVSARIPTYLRKTDTSYILSPEEDKAQWDALAREESEKFNRMNARDGLDPNESNFQTWEDYVNWGRNTRKRMKSPPRFKRVTW